MPWKLVGPVLLSAALLTGCGQSLDFVSPWEKRTYCSDLGMKVSKAQEAAAKKFSSEMDDDAISANETNHSIWAYCAPVDKCVMQNSRHLWAIGNAKMVTMDDTVTVLDLMTNEILLTIQANKRQLNSVEYDSFEKQRDFSFPGCFSGDPKQVEVSTP